MGRSHYSISSNGNPKPIYSNLLKKVTAKPHQFEWKIGNKNILVLKCFDTTIHTSIHLDKQLQNPGKPSIIEQFDTWTQCIYNVIDSFLIPYQSTCVHVLKPRAKILHPSTKSQVQDFGVDVASIKSALCWNQHPASWSMLWCFVESGIKIESIFQRMLKKSFLQLCSKFFLYFWLLSFSLSSKY